MRKDCTTLLILALLGSSASAAVFQFCVPVATSKGRSRAYLWVPPEAERLYGAVVGGMTLAERELARDPCIRRACADEGLAIVFFKCGLARVEPERVLADLARVSGYRELAVAPLMFVGHSAGGPQAKAAAVRMAGRCFGLVLYRGGVPGGEDPVPPGIPVLMMTGQFDEFARVMRDGTGRESWQGGRDALARFRAAEPANLASIVVEPGAGHFAWSQRNARYLGLFIRKAARSRIPRDWNIERARPPVLNRIDYRAGWLSDLRIESTSGHRPAAYRDYTGAAGEAAWQFDEEIALATVRYHERLVGKKDQFIRWNDPFWVDAGARFFFTGLDWVADGQTFEVHPVYAETYPGRYNGRGPMWLDAGKPVGHSAAPIYVKPVSGPVVAVGRNRLRIRYDELAPATESPRVTFMACSDGDEQYRYTEQVGMMPRGFSGLKKGAEQRITFAPLGPLDPAGPGIPLKATSDSGLPVEYHVLFGPAVVDGTVLRVAELPSRARLPVTVKVVAYQFGRAIEPFVKTAEPVVQTTFVRKSEQAIVPGNQVGVNKPDRATGRESPG